MGVLPGLPRQRSGWAGGLLSWGEGGGGVGWGGGTVCCQKAWQVETQRLVTRGEHGSVREDRSERMEAVERWGGGLSDEVRRSRVEGEGDKSEVNEGKGGGKIEMIRRELSKCELG